MPGDDVAEAQVVEEGGLEVGLGRAQAQWTALSRIADARAARMGRRDLDRCEAQDAEACSTAQPYVRWLDDLPLSDRIKERVCDAICAATEAGVNATLDERGHAVSLGTFTREGDPRYPVPVPPETVALVLAYVERETRPLRHALRHDLDPRQPLVATPALDRLLGPRTRPRGAGRPRAARRRVASRAGPGDSDPDQPEPGPDPGADVGLRTRTPAALLELAEEPER